MTLAHPGFADPVHDGQACFRSVLDAMAKPGTIHRIDTPATPPPPLDRATAAVLLTLVDLDTPIWLDPGAAAASEWIDFHCGAPHAPIGTARFALALTTIPLETLYPGSDEGPEDSATLLLQIGDLGSGPRYRLSGPGLQAPISFQAEGLPADFVRSWAANHALFPRGVDLLLCAGDRLAAFPRTMSIEEEG